MRIKITLVAAITICCLYSLQSCKKSDPAPAPPPLPVIKPDTLTAGWTKQVVAVGSNMSDIFFNTSTNGYACADNGVFKTTDGGTNWVQLNLTNNQWNNCFVTADGKASLVTYASNNIFRTIDGGSSFTNPALGSVPLDIFFTDNNNGFSIAVDGLYKSVDAGVSWQRITTTGLSSSSNYASLSFINNTTGWVVSQAGIFRSLGSLTNWQASFANGGASSNYASVYAVSATVIYVGDFSGQIFKSTDGGANFNFIKKLEDASFTDIHFLTDQIGYASSGRSIYKTADGGSNWSKVVSLGENFISEIHFTDATHGWACANKGVVLTFK